MFWDYLTKNQVAYNLSLAYAMVGIFAENNTNGSMGHCNVFSS